MCVYVEGEGVTPCVKVWHGVGLRRRGVDSIAVRSQAPRVNNLTAHTHSHARTHHTTAAAAATTAAKGEYCMTAGQDKVGE